MNLRIFQSEHTLKQRNAGTGEMEGLRPVTLNWNGGAPVSSPVGEALIVAPQEKYQIEVDYQIDVQTAREWYQGSSDFDEGNLVDPTKTYKAKLITDLVRTTTSGDPAAPVAFAEGESYLVTITLYGPEEIKITTTLTAWTTSDQDIKIGQD